MNEVLISMPTTGDANPALLRRAIDAVIGQTYEDWRLIVQVDGMLTQDRSLVDVFASIDDPRVAFICWGSNRGRYYRDATSAQAANGSFRWLAIHDSDDAAKPTWLESMLAASDAYLAEHGSLPDVVHTSQELVYLDGNSEVLLQCDLATDVDLDYYGHLASLWNPNWLLPTNSKSGLRPDFRCGWDTMVSTMVRRTGRVAIVREPQYVRHQNPRSLTTSELYGHGSYERERAAARMRSWFDANYAPSVSASLLEAVYRDSEEVRGLMIDFEM